MSLPLPSTAALDEVVGLLGLAARGDAGTDVFLAGHTELAMATNHVFGGLAAAQALVAAARTVPTGDGERPIHSLHAYFLRAGDPRVPLELHVERLRDGRSFTHRRVRAVQHDKAILDLTCSFAVAESGLEHQMRAPSVPAAEDLPPDWEVLVATPEPDFSVTRHGPFEIRSAETHSRIARDRGERSDHSRMWMRTPGPVRDDVSDGAPDNLLLHTALLVYASDMTVLDPTTRPHGLSMSAGDVLPTTLDHAMWFHRQARADAWFLVDLDSPWAGSGRGYSRGRVFDGDGALVAQIAQEGLIRLPG